MSLVAHSLRRSLPVRLAWACPNSRRCRVTAGCPARLRGAALAVVDDYDREARDEMRMIDRERQEARDRYLKDELE